MAQKASANEQLLDESVLMCGISGTVGIPDPGVVSAMNLAQAHRGPDDSGVHFDPVHQVALGHRRLSILDLSTAGHQPMADSSSKVWITYNGEVYNYVGLRSELEGLGHRFRTATDTEVLLEAYVRWGTEFVTRLRGMFSFAIYDLSTSTPRLFLARDRFGIKPLYYAFTPDCFLFASELKGMLASGLIPRLANRQAIWDYLTYGAVPQPQTLIRGVQSLLPGHTLSLCLDPGSTPVLQKYWDLRVNSAKSFPDVENLSETEALRQLRQLMEEATRLHLISDVPVGCFLSGGIDSTAVAGLMSRVVTHPIKTYSVGFENKFQHLNELSWARMAAERFGTVHHEVIVTGAQVADQFDAIVSAIDQPSLDGTNSFFVAQAASKGVTVALSGVGGDELFAGYHHFRQFAQAARWERVPPALLRAFCSILPSRFCPNKDFLRSTPLQRFASLRALVSETEKQSLTSREFRDGGTFRSPPFLESLSYTQELRQVSYFEVNSYLPNTLLRDMDAMSMASSLEVRPPLLDHVVAEFAFALPDKLKLRGSAAKFALTECLSDLLPGEIVHRPKMGFEMPLRDWLAGPLRQRALSALACSQATEIFDASQLVSVRDKLKAGQRPQQPIWAYILLLEWLSLHKFEV